MSENKVLMIFTYAGIAKVSIPHEKLTSCKVLCSTTINAISKNLMVFILFDNSSSIINEWPVAC
jgi:hypothetical protein